MHTRFRETYNRETDPLQPCDLFYVTYSDGKCDVHDPPCERHLYVICPDGSWWDIDGRCGNCTLPDDKGHRCWVRHGDPATGLVTVDKSGASCAAGAGSVNTGGYHGYLRNGEFIAC